MLIFEELESRLVLGVVLKGTVLEVTGGELNDTCVIRKQADGSFLVTYREVTDNGRETYSSKDRIVAVLTAIKFRGGAGNDKFDCDPKLKVPCEADGGKGDDTLLGGAAQDKLDGGDGNDVVEERGKD